MKQIPMEKAVRAAAALLLALLSVLVVSGHVSSAAFHAKSIAALEEKQTTVLELAAASTAASAALSLLPGDAATPIAEKLADLSSYFLIVLSAIILEKYLLTVTGYTAFTVLIPAACVLYAVNVFLDRRVLRAAVWRVVLFSLAIVLVIPASLQVTGLIERTYQTSIESTVERAKDATAEVEQQTNDTGGAAESKGWLSGLFSKVTDGVSGAVSSAAEKVGQMLNSFIEALAVLLVTSCLIPILVLLLFVWLARVLLGIRLPEGGFRRLHRRDARGGSGD